MHESVDESLRKICKYQQNVLQHYYLFDNLVSNKIKGHETLRLKVKVVQNSNQSTFFCPASIYCCVLKQETKSLVH